MTETINPDKESTKSNLQNDTLFEYLYKNEILTKKTVGFEGTVFLDKGHDKVTVRLI